MAYWNHRVLERITSEGEVWLSIIEVHYNANNKIKMWSEPRGITGCSLEELNTTRKLMKTSLTKPILVEVTIKGKTKLTEKT